MITGSNYAHTPARQNKLVHDAVLQKTNMVSARLLGFSSGLFVFCLGRKINIPIVEKILPLMHFQQSTASVHVFTYKSEFISCPLQSDLF